MDSSCQVIAIHLPEPCALYALPSFAAALLLVNHPGQYSTTAHFQDNCRLRGRETSRGAALHVHRRYCSCSTSTDIDLMVLELMQVSATTLQVTPLARWRQGEQGKSATGSHSSRKWSLRHRRCEGPIGARGSGVYLALVSAPSTCTAHSVRYSPPTVIA